MTTQHENPFKTAIEKILHENNPSAPSLWAFVMEKSRELQGNKTKWTLTKVEMNICEPWDDYEKK